VISAETKKLEFFFTSLSCCQISVLLCRIFGFSGDDKVATKLSMLSSFSDACGIVPYHS
jgi:hypothetical protein